MNIQADPPAAPVNVRPEPRSDSSAGPLRVLYYNWADYLDEEGRGGGVSQYQRALITALEDVPGVECCFLSSGLSHDLLAGKPRWEQVRHGPKVNREHRFELVNARPIAPGHNSFGNPAQIGHRATTAAFADFIAANGPFDVIHFNNLEGLPAEVLELKHQFPKTSIVLSLHNYYPLCPQVNLWYAESTTCRDFRDGQKCSSCLAPHPRQSLIRVVLAIAYQMKCFGLGPRNGLYRLLFGPGLRVAGRTIRLLRSVTRKLRARGREHGSIHADRPSQTAAQFRQRRTRMVGLINTHCDAVLGVSDRVCDIARRHGVRPELLQTVYIGTDQADRFQRTRPRSSLLRPDGTLKLCYLGYMRRDKGYEFLVEALSVLPDPIARRLHLVIAARPRTAADLDQLARLRPRFASLEHRAGYHRDELDTLLAEVDLGIVPPLWEDNLPQVALEMHARHIPLLTSDVGGVQEISNCPDFVFRAGDIAQFQDRLITLIDGDPSMQAYWRSARPPVGMATHVRELLAVYAGATAATQLNDIVGGN